MRHLTTEIEIEIVVEIEIVEIVVFKFFPVRIRK